MSSKYEAMFLDEPSCADLRSMAELYFNVQINPEWSNDPLYLLISRNSESIKKHRHRLGQRVSLKVIKLGYNPTLEVLVAIVQLKTNFTCNPVPHITIMKNPKINQYSVNQIVTGWVADKAETIFRPIVGDPLVVKGWIGVAEDDYHEEDPDSLGSVTKPEMTVTVTSAPPPQSQYEQLDQYVNTASGFKIALDDGSEIPMGKPLMSDPNFGTSINSEGQETYDGYPVFCGPKRGKYIVRDGKKVYLSAILAHASSKSAKHSSKYNSGVTYNVTTLNSE